MSIRKRISIKNLIVNPANDRHGELGSESAAIEWLLVNKTEKMKDLLDDIASRKGIVIEEPLVMKSPDHEKYFVYDGNRRVTCLKLLHGLVPDNITNPLRSRITAIKANSSFEMNEEIDCRVESDINVVNDILELRHTPGNSGAGQLKWDGHEKENFLERIGRSKKLNFAREVNRLLIETGYLNSEDRIPLSIFNRLFASKELKRRVGIDVENNNVRLINDQDVCYKAVTRIAKDMIAGKRTLDDVWDNNKKTKYLDELEKEGLLPSAKNRLGAPKIVIGGKEKGLFTTTKPPHPPHLREHLLATNFPTPEHGEFFSIKFCQLFYELQNTLRFNSHATAISIAFRVFLEILTNTYLKTHEIDEKGSLAGKIKNAFVHMQQSMKMPEEVKAFVNKLSDENQYFSINTLHKVVHNNMQISEADLRAYVNNLDAFLRETITSINHQQNTRRAIGDAK